MKATGWVVLSAVAAGALAVVALECVERRETSALERRRGELEARRAPVARHEAIAKRYETARRMIEIKRRSADELQTGSTALAPLLSALAEPFGPRISIEGVRLSRGAIEILGSADSPVAAHSVGERLRDRGLVADFDLRRFQSAGAGGSFKLTASLPVRERDQTGSGKEATP